MQVGAAQPTILPQLAQSPRGNRSPHGQKPEHRCAPESALTWVDEIFGTGKAGRRLLGTLTSSQERLQSVESNGGGSVLALWPAWYFVFRCEGYGCPVRPAARSTAAVRHHMGALGCRLLLIPEGIEDDSVVVLGKIQNRSSPRTHCYVYTGSPAGSPGAIYFDAGELGALLHTSDTGNASDLAADYFRSSNSGRISSHLFHVDLTGYQSPRRRAILALEG